MTLHGLDVLRSPCCRAQLRAAEEVGSDEQGVVCEACGGAYPVRGGIPCLVHVDHTSLAELTELVAHQAHRRISARIAEHAVCSSSRRRDYDRITDAAWRAFEQLVPEFDCSSPPRILDVGAGNCVTSALLAKRNAVVVATDLQLAGLRNPGDVETRDPIEWLEEDQREQARARVQNAPYYLDRVQASADRLPFADCLFDYVFCRALLHHVPNVRKAIVEMARVLRPGGKLVVCAEPFRGGLDSEFDCVKGEFDYLVGVNEHYPRLSEYLRSFKVAGMGRAKILTMHLRLGLHWERPPWLLQRAIGRALRPLMWRQLPGRFRPLLRLCSGGVSIVAAKRRHHPAAHKAGPRLLDPGLMDGDPAHAPNLTRLVRELRRSMHCPNRIRTRKAPQDCLRLGWYLPEPIQPGPLHARYSFPYCVATLGVPRGARNIHIKCRGFAGVTGAPTCGVVRINGADVGGFSLEDAEWHSLNYPLPADEPVIDVELETQEVFIPDRHLNNGDTRALGIAVAEIAVV